VIDLFSGLGGFSQAFLDRGHYVERYDFNPEFENIPNTIIKNVFDMSPIDLEIAVQLIVLILLMLMIPRIKKAYKLLLS